MTDDDLEARRLAEQGDQPDPLFQEPSYDRHGVKVFAGDCLDVLAGMADASVDAVITDPPYGLAEHKPAALVTALTAWANGDRERVPDGRGFMGKEWDRFVPPPAVWDECLRVLKPGGHLACFAAPRTMDLMGLSIRLAGFDIRDGIGTASLLAWTFGSGFPKGQDIGKAIDRMAGAEREVIGEKVYADGHVQRSNGTDLGRMNDDAWTPTDGRSNTAPATPEATQWDGWNTSLKPAWEPIILARKPLSESSVAGNVLAYGTGALNVDACRTATFSDGPGTTPRSSVAGARGAMAGPMDRVAYDGAAGRWPTNVLFSHSPHAWYALRHDVYQGTAEAVLAYYGAEQAVHSLREAVQGDALGSGSPQVLQPGVRWGQPAGQAESRVGRTDLRDLSSDVPSDAGLVPHGSTPLLLGGVPEQGAPTGPHRQGPHDGSTPEDGGRRHREVHPGEVVAVEGRPVSGPVGLLARDDRDVAAGDPGTAARVDQAAVRTGAPRGGGPEDRSPGGEARGGPSPQRREGGQPTGEPDGDPAVRSQHRTPADRAGVPGATGRGRQAQGGKRRLEVRDDLIPSGWADLFEYVGEECADECAPGCPVAELDAQSGTSTTGHRSERSRNASVDGTTWGTDNHRSREYPGESGGPSRFFPVFRWEAKAPTAERPQVDGIAHPTVKPLDLMRWLVRLVAPPGGVVLDPFAGSGTTLHAARAEGFRAIGIEREPTYLPLIKARLDARPRQSQAAAAPVPDDEPMDLLDFLGDAS